MALSFRVILLFFISIPISQCVADLTLDYYKDTCPDFDRVVREHVIEKQQEEVSTAAAALRLFFHDCFVDGCDASVLITSNSFIHAERDSDINLSLPGDGFDIVIKIKNALELLCPGVVSCADILAAATRNLIVMVGGPRYQLFLGRKDGLVSDSKNVAGNVPVINMTMDETIMLFERKGFNVQEMVALMGGHTIGFSNCKEFGDRLSDPEMNPKYAEGLRALCGDNYKNTTMAAFLDVMTPGKFDNMYYKNLQRGLALLSSDHMLVKDPRTKGFVELYATNEQAFFKDFSAAMEKLGRIGIKTSPQEGDVRRRCDNFNNGQF